MVEAEVVVAAAAQEVAILLLREVRALLHTVLHRQRDHTRQFQFILTIDLPTITIATTTAVLSMLGLTMDTPMALLTLQPLSCLALSLELSSY